MQQAGDDFIGFLHSFLGQYPDYGKTGGRNLTFTGESYAGKYLPYFSSRIIDDGSFNL